METRRNLPKQPGNPIRDPLMVKSDPVQTPTNRQTLPTTHQTSTAQTPTTSAPLAQAVFHNDGAATAADLGKIPTKSGGPVKAGGGVLGFLLQAKQAPLAVGPEIVSRAGDNAAMKALLGVRAACIPEFSPLVEIVRADGSTITGMMRGLDEQGRAVVDGGRGRKHALELDEPLRAVRHQMDTTGDLNTALVTVFDASKHITDPWQPTAFIGKTLVVETFDAEHPSLAIAAKKGDVSGRPLLLTGVSDKGLEQKGGTLAREHWQIARIAIEQPAFSYKKDGVRLTDVGDALLPGTPVEVAVSGGARGRLITGTFVGMAKDAEGDDYVVVQDKSNVKHALRDVVDVRAAALTKDLWREPTYGSVYAS